MYQLVAILNVWSITTLCFSNFLADTVYYSFCFYLVSLYTDLVGELKQINLHKTECRRVTKIKECIFFHNEIIKLGLFYIVYMKTKNYFYFRFIGLVNNYFSNVIFMQILLSMITMVGCLYQITEVITNCLILY